MKELYLIAQTHWDREWYQPFQEFRQRLVNFMDDLITTLETDSEYKMFHMDGQTIVLEDYLEIRPENEERLRRLIKDGRILIGPWYTMPDEFLVSGESLIRNLQKGHEICADYGVQALKAGYVVDIFGHNNQMPQIFNGFDIHNALLFRGIADYPKDTFIWQGVDGSQLTTAKLDKNRAYSNFYFAVRNPFDGREYDDDEMVSRMEALLNYCESGRTSDALLMMDGVDHIECEPLMPKMMKTLEERIEGIQFKFCRLEEYFAHKDSVGGLETLEGALYNVGKEGLNNLVLKNVLSSHVELKQANDRCECKLTAIAEPLDVFSRTVGLPMPPDYPSMGDRRTYFDTAWRYLIKNHPHDSICGCSLTDVHKDNEYRFRQVEQIADMLTNDSLKLLTHNTDTTGKGTTGAIYFYNPSQAAVTGYKTVELPLLIRNPAMDYNLNFRFYDPAGNEVDWQMIGIRKGIRPELKRRNLISFAAYDVLTAAMPLDIPAFGYAVYTYDVLINEVPGAGDYQYKKFYQPKRAIGSMRTAPDCFDTGAIAVKINANGSLDVTDKAAGTAYSSLLTFEDCGDCGDGWNYVKPLMDGEVLSSCGKCDCTVTADGPFAAVIKLRHYLIIPQHREIFPFVTRSAETSENVLDVYLTLNRGSADIEVRTEFHNRSAEHRLRVLLPLAFAADHFYTKTPFDICKWTPDYEQTGGHNEIDTRVYPGQGIAYAESEKDGLAVYSRGLYEFSLLKESRTLALTLMRAFASEVAVGQLDRHHFDEVFTSEFALSFGKKQMADLAIAGESWRNGLVVRDVELSAGALPNKDSFMKLEGAVLTALTAGKNGFTARMYNPGCSASPVSLSLTVPAKKACLTDLLGNAEEALAPVDGMVKFTLDAGKIANLFVES